MHAMGSHIGVPPHNVYCLMPVSAISELRFPTSACLMSVVGRGMAADRRWCWARWSPRCCGCLPFMTGSGEGSLLMYCVVCRV